MIQHHPEMEKQMMERSGIERFGRRQEAAGSQAASPRKYDRRGVVVRAEKIWPRSVIVASQLGLLGLLLALWEVGARVGLVDPFFWSYPSAIFQSGLQFASRWSALYDTWFTVFATLIGFVVGTLGGAAIGLSFWWSKNIAAIIEPYVVVFNAVPKLAFAPLIILIFGIGIGSKIALAIALTMVISILAAYSGVKAIDEDLVRMMYALGGRKYQIFLKAVVPSVMPWVISSMRVNIGMALTGTIVGEFVSSKYGLGKLIMYAGSTYDMALIWVGIIVLSTVAVLMYATVTWLERVLLRGIHATAG
jgi:NitT/TauT family transport system permease protein